MHINTGILRAGLNQKMFGFNSFLTFTPFRSKYLCRLGLVMLLYLAALCSHRYQASSLLRLLNLLHAFGLVLPLGGRGRVVKGVSH